MKNNEATQSIRNAMNPCKNNPLMRNPKMSATQSDLGALTTAVLARLTEAIPADPMDATVGFDTAHLRFEAARREIAALLATRGLDIPAFLALVEARTSARWLHVVSGLPVIDG
jgi:hypothetical protein